MASVIAKVKFLISFLTKEIFDRLGYQEKGKQIKEEGGKYMKITCSILSERIIFMIKNTQNMGIETKKKTTVNK